MSSIDQVRLLDNVDIPDGLDVRIERDPVAFFQRKVTLNKGGGHWFGTGLRQGNRLQFSTAMPINDYLKVVDIDRAGKGATISELKEKSNRPKIPQQEKDIKDYLRETACIGEKWIFPNFTLNYGVGWIEGSTKARLTLLVTDDETLVWPAIFEPPSGQRMPSTDGAHRTQSMKDMMEKERPQGIEALLANAVGVTIVMESSNDDRHQDFSDCGQARPIAGSVKDTFDKRNIVVRTARELVLGNKFLHKYVDATSPSVNLSSNSALIWSMSAVRGSLINAFYAKHEEFEALSKDQKEAILAGAPTKISEFIDEVVKAVPVFRQLVDETATPASFRKQRGGCVLMRGAGFGLLMRVFRHAQKQSIRFSTMAADLAQVDWFVLREEPPEPRVGADQIYAYLKENALAPWFKLVAINPGDGTWRLKGTNDNLDAAFAELIAPSAKAAE